MPDPEWPAIMHPTRRRPVPCYLRWSRLAGASARPLRPALWELLGQSYLVSDLAFFRERDDFLHDQPSDRILNLSWRERLSKNRLNLRLQRLPLLGTVVLIRFEMRGQQFHPLGNVHEHRDFAERGMPGGEDVFVFEMSDQRIKAFVPR